MTSVHNLNYSSSSLSFGTTVKLVLLALVFFSLIFANYLESWILVTYRYRDSNNKFANINYLCEIYSNCCYLAVQLRSILYNSILFWPTVPVSNVVPADVSHEYANKEKSWFKKKKITTFFTLKHCTVLGLD